MKGSGGQARGKRRQNTREPCLCTAQFTMGTKKGGGRQIQSDETYPIEPYKINVSKSKLRLALRYSQ